MRISTNQIYSHGTNNLQSQQLKILQLEDQISSGLKVSTPADDPIATAQIQLMSHRLAHAELLQINRVTGESILTLEENTIGNAVRVVQRLKEMQVQAGNGSLSNADRNTLSIEAQSLLQELLNYANTKDINNGYMFSGSLSDIPAVSMVAGKYTYMGDSAQRIQAVSESLYLDLNDTADEVFMRIPGGNGTFSVSQPSEPNNGNAVINVGAVISPTDYIPGDYSIIFSNDADGNILVSADITVGSPPVTTQVLEPLPYVDGGAINFNGMEFIISGVPNAGDSFLVSSSYESVFDTVTKMIGNLRFSNDTPNNKAKIQTNNNQLLVQLDNVLNHLVNCQASVGIRLNQLDAADLCNEGVIIASKEALKNLKELDYTSALVNYNAQLMGLQTAQQSFVKIQNLSVFNYI